MYVLACVIPLSFYGGLIPKYSEVTEPYNIVGAFSIKAQTMYILPIALKPASGFFLKSKNLKQLIISLKTYSTETYALLIDLLIFCWSGVHTAPL